MDRLEQLLAFRNEDPDDSFTRFAIAAEYVKLGRHQEGRKAFEELIADDPEYVGAYYHLGKLYERLGETELSVNIYRTGIEISTKISDFHSRAELQSALLEAEGMGFD